MAYINGKEILLSPQVNINNEGIPPGYVKPKGQLNVTENGVYPVPECAFVDVNVATRELAPQVETVTPSSEKEKRVEPKEGHYLEAVVVEKIKTEEKLDVAVTGDGQVIEPSPGHYLTKVTLDVPDMGEAVVPTGKLTINNDYINKHNNNEIGIDVSHVAELFLEVEQGGGTGTLTINMDYLYKHLGETIPLDDYKEIKIDITLADLEWGA